MNGERLYRIRWAVRAVLGLGLAASIAANVLAARPSVPGRVIAAWSPVALLLTIELISRVPVHRPSLAWVRRGATAVISGIAAWVSYWHMVEVCSRYGETATSAHLIPFSVDGLVVVASVCLVEIGGQVRADAAGVADPALEAMANPQPLIETHAGESEIVDSPGYDRDPQLAGTVEPLNPAVDEPSGPPAEPPSHASGS
ncbi:DUF2637 domain-containing protein, partial [Protofrankia coriariae]|uniref:DUF2637 domain-containing protein n=1 Tax=Protofrankia coriariae TaxID=1562887 RepID=UPI0012F6C89A